MSSAKETANPKIQPRDVFLVRTIELILSVTEANVCPGSMTGAVSTGTVATAAVSNPRRAVIRGPRFFRLIAPPYGQSVMASMEGYLAAADHRDRGADCELVPGVLYEAKYSTRRAPSN